MICDDEIEEMKAELEDLRKFKRVVMQNFEELSKTTAQTGYRVVQSLPQGGTLTYEQIYDKHR